MTLAPNGEKEALRYLEVEPGDDLNLDAKEMAAFRALNSASKDGAPHPDGHTSALRGHEHGTLECTRIAKGDCARGRLSAKGSR